MVNASQIRRIPYTNPPRRAIQKTPKNALSCCMAEINEILIDLYNTNFFSDIKLNVVNGILIVNVKEKKIIQL